MGEYQHALDDKGRLTIPSKFRNEIGDRFVITKGLDNCLFAYPQKEWATLENKLSTLPLTRSDARAFVRFFFSGAVEGELDKQGRVLIPNNLREYAQIDRDVVIIGVMNRFEIWAKNLWEAYRQRSEESFAELAEKINELGI